jgi:hypothetical protein
VSVSGQATATAVTATQPVDGDISSNSVTCNAATNQYVVGWSVANYIESRAVTVSQVSGAGELTYLPQAAKADPHEPVPSSFLIKAATLDPVTDIITPAHVEINQYVPGDTKGSYHKSVTVAEYQTKTVLVPAEYTAAVSVHASGYSKGPVAWSAPSGCPTTKATTAATVKAKATPSPSGAASCSDATTCPVAGAAGAAGAADGGSVQAIGSGDGSSGFWVWFTPAVEVLLGVAVIGLLAVLLLLRFWVIGRRRAGVASRAPRQRPQGVGPQGGEWR